MELNLLSLVQCSKAPQQLQGQERFEADVEIVWSDFYLCIYLQNISPTALFSYSPPTDVPVHGGESFNLQIQVLQQVQS